MTILLVVKLIANNESEGGNFGAGISVLTRHSWILSLVDSLMAYNEAKLQGGGGLYVGGGATSLTITSTVVMHNTSAMVLVYSLMGLRPPHKIHYRAYNVASRQRLVVVSGFSGGGLMPHLRM